MIYKQFNRRFFFLVSGLFFLFVCSSCKKYLDKKSSSNKNIPSSVEELQYLLDNYEMMNNNKLTPYTEAGSDVYYIKSTDWQSLSETDRNIHVWKKHENIEERAAGWETYDAVFYCNIVMEELKKLKTETTDAYNNVKGSALFYRSFYFYGLSQLYAKPYNKSTAASDPGIPVRTDPDYTIPSVRATVQQTYDRIITDLKQAAQLLPVLPVVKTRPSKPAAYALLARTWLSMLEYDSAGYYANQCLQLYDSLMDYNSLNAAANAPIARLNKEIIFWSRSRTATLLGPSRARIDSILYRSYDNNDLRKTVYYKANTGSNAGTYNFKGDYDGTGTNSGYVFGGMITDEIFLIRAECYARAGKVGLALDDLNTLLRSRWKTGTFVPVMATDPQDALGKILTERKKELIFRGTRWTDLRRLQYDPTFAVIPKRVINNEVFELPVNSPRYSLQIPISVILLSGMPQNP